MVSAWKPFLAAASAANKSSAPTRTSASDANGKPPVATAARKPVAPAAATAATVVAPAGTGASGQSGSEVDSSKTGDDVDRSNWVCPSCKKVVFGRKSSCYKCKTTRPANATLAPARVSGPVTSTSGGGSGGGAPAVGARKPVDREVREGDWVCGTCGGHNFANKIACFTCRTPRPEGYVIDSSLRDKNSEKKPGDWTCPKCGGNVFAKRTRCYVCSHSRNAPV